MKFRLLLSLFILSGLLIPALASAQDATITGRVTHEDASGFRICVCPLVHPERGL